jgi:hypothetical protein
MAFYDLDKLQNKSLDIVMFVIYFLYISLALGIYFISPQYITLLHNIVKLYVCFFLLYRFNPWRTTKCNHLDKRIAFSAGFFLLSTTIFENILKYFISKTKTNVEKIKRHIETNLYPNKNNTT